MKLRLSKRVCIVSTFCAVTAISSPAQTFTTLHSFDKTDGAFPAAGLVQGTDGNLYGTTAGGGANNNTTHCSLSGCGTVFKVTAGGTLTTLYSFCAQTNCTDGADPVAGLVQATDGNFYGTTAYGGANNNAFVCSVSGCGTFFKITPSGTLTTLYSFCSQNQPQSCTDGVHPNQLVQATDGNFYGTTSVGGPAPSMYGTIFKITPSGTLTTLHSFVHADGASSEAGLVQATDGNFYGTTSQGGANNWGTIFKITPNGTLTTLYNFCSLTNCADGAFPLAGLVQATDGNFYGTAGAYGTGSHGTIFKITPSGTLTTLHSFCLQACSDQGNPHAGLIQATDGNFYGTTGGISGSGGTVFKITPSGTLTTLYSFCSLTNCTDGAGPSAGLVQATDGNFYGTTGGGGASQNCNTSQGCGTVFKLAVGRKRRAQVTSE